jgi:hypothetical protein
MKVQGPGKSCSAIHTAGHSLRPLSRATTTRPAMRPRPGGGGSRLRLTSWMATDHSRRVSFDPAEPSRSSWRDPPIDDADRSLPFGGTQCPIDLAARHR